MTNWAVIDALIDQPTTRRENKSSMSSQRLKTPRQRADQGYQNACPPARGKGAVLMLPEANAQAMQAHRRLRPCG